MTITYDPFSAEMHADPFPTYARLREEAPLYHNDDLGFWALSRYSDVQAVSRDWQTFSYDDGVDIDGQGDMFNDDGDFLDADPPKHTLLRGAVQQYFRPKAIKDSMEGLVRERADEIISPLLERGSADLADELAWPLPISVACALLGIRREDEPLLTTSARVMALREPGRRELPQQAVQAHKDLESYIEDELRAVWHCPREGLLSQIAHSRLQGKRISETAAVGMGLLIFVASIETTASHLSTALMLLGRHPDQRHRLAADLTAVPGAVEEALRFEAPVQVFRRLTTREVERHGITIPQGEQVYLIYGAANRDSTVFEDGERFDVYRPHHRNLTFGEGIHHCLGAPLARLEGRIAIERILQLMPDYELSGPIERIPSHSVRGLLSLAVEFRPRLATSIAQ